MTSQTLTSCMTQMTPEEKKRFIADRFSEIMEVMGLDIENESLKETPNRVAKMYIDEIFSGLNEENFPDLTFFENQNTESDTVCVKTHFVSHCEHHFLPFHGTATIAYIPNKKLIGLSKIPRIVQYFAKRPQMQERLTQQIADNISTLLETEHVAVSITAEHFCVKARGVEETNSETTTQTLRGKFKEDRLLAF